MTTLICRHDLGKPGSGAQGVRPEVANARKALFGLDDIRYPEGLDHMRLTNKGQQGAHRMYETATNILKEMIAVLEHDEISSLLTLGTG